MLTVSEVQSKLKGYPPHIIEEYERFTNHRDEKSLFSFVFGIMGFLIDHVQNQELKDLPDSTNLRTDLQIESITIAEMVFLLEDIFVVEISNEDVVSIQTIGDLKSFLKRMLNL